MKGLWIILAFFSTTIVQAQSAKYTNSSHYDSATHKLYVKFTSLSNTYSRVKIEAYVHTDAAKFIDFDCTLGKVFPIITEVWISKTKLKLITRISQKLYHQRGKLIVTLIFKVDPEKIPMIEIKRQYLK